MRFRSNAAIAKIAGENRRFLLDTAAPTILNLKSFPDIDIAAATGLLAARCNSYEESHAMMKDWVLEQLTLLADRGASAHAEWQEAAELIRWEGEYRWVGRYHFRHRSAERVFTRGREFLRACAIALRRLWGNAR